MKWITKTLMGRLVALFLGVSLVPIAIVGVISFERAQTALDEEAYTELAIGRDGRRAQILDYLHEKKTTIGILAKIGVVQEALDGVDDYYASNAPDPTGPFPLDRSGYPELRTRIDHLLAPFVEAAVYHDILLVCAKHGHVMYSTARQADLGTNLGTGPYRDSGLARVWKRVADTGTFQLEDRSFYTPSGEPAVFFGAPVRDAKGAIRAVVITEIGADEFDELMLAAGAVGETGELFLVGPDLTVRSTLRSGAEGADRQKVDTVATRAVVAGATGVTPMTDDRGHDVLAAYTPLGLGEAFGASFDWGVVAQMSQAEAYHAVTELQVWLLLLGGVVTLVVALVGTLAARWLARPILQITDVVSRVSDGDLTQDVPVLDREDELGVLNRSVGKMVASLRQQTADLLDGLNVIATSTSQISSTSTELATASSQTASAVAETTVTAEEVKQTTQVASEKAQLVSELARKTLQISRSGNDAVDRTVERMHAIRAQMETVASSVVRLSEQSQAIGEIIEAVDDLAEQSNLLAVNAAIEAAKAGEQGRGFAVVAQEVKSLAEQSKQATAQVRRILSDIQKATGSAVMATEQGTKAVDAGSAQSAEAGEAIRTLSDSIREAAQAAAQIAASSQQQFAGVEQVTEAMEGIREASQQNVTGAQQLEVAVKGLNELGARLRDIAQRYRV